ncbi:MAG TPA: acyltransferase [Iamia sp.]
MPGLDGVRALAAVAIVVHHAASTAEIGSGLAVLARPASVMDGAVVVFFVLSGFLVYRPFAEAHLGESPVPPVGRYLRRRAARVLPAYWVALAGLWALGAVDLGRSWWRMVLLLQPYDRLTVYGGIFQAWTLSVEVAFYLLVPVWAAGVRRIGRGRSSALIELLGCAALVVAAFAFRAVVSATNPTWRGLAFQWLPGYLDAFGAGMALAVLRARGRPERGAQWAPGLCWAAAAAICAGYAWRIGAPTDAMLLDPHGAYRGTYWQRRQLVLVVVGLLLVAPLVFAGGRSRLVAVLSSRPVVLLGTVSYGLYLWHLGWIDLVVEHVDGGFPVALAAGLGLGTASALVSWYGVERPLLRRVRGR